MKLMRISPDKEKAKSLRKLAELRETKISLFNKETDSPLITETYYEICKELMTAILFCDGYKTLSHMDLIEYIKRINQLTEEEIYHLDNLRKKRNKINYYGIFTDAAFIERNSTRYKIIIKKLKQILKEKLSD